MSSKQAAALEAVGAELYPLSNLAMNSFWLKDHRSWSSLVNCSGGTGRLKKFPCA
jgi:hypothetical protein